MTDEQRAKAAERLATAREKKQQANPPVYANVHESVRNLPDDHAMSRKNVMEWIKLNKDKRTAAKASVRRKEKGAIALLANVDAYIRQMERYLRNGDWISTHYGPNDDKPVMYKCVALGYHWFGPNKGMPKREVGVFYPDLGAIWTKEMYEEEGYVLGESPPPVSRKRLKKNTGPMAQTDEILNDNIKKLTK